MFFLTQYTLADPTGANYSGNVTESAPDITPTNRSDDGGTITTMLLTGNQQNNNWKGYVGNVSGTLRLDDATGNTLYDWPMSASDIQGEIFITRASSVTWGSIGCPSNTSINNEDTALGFIGTAIDSINNTFNSTVHASMIVAGRTINASACNATATYVNSTRQAQATADFQEILLHDGTNMVYATTINQDSYGFDSHTSNNTYDFQAIVADNVSASITTYFFYMELGS
jgi:hypothetical protein